LRRPEGPPPTYVGQANNKSGHNWAFCPPLQLHQILQNHLISAELSLSNSSVTPNKYKRNASVYIAIREYVMYYRGSGILAFHRPSPLIMLGQRHTGSLRKRDNLLWERGSQIIGRRESLVEWYRVLDNTINTLCIATQKERDNGITGARWGSDSYFHL
jgi:hypothetical protein